MNGLVTDEVEVPVMRRIIKRLAVILPDGSKELLPIKMVIKHNLRAGMKAPFTGYPIIGSGIAEVFYDEKLKDWIEVSGEINEMNTPGE
jgi:hypothetical protein